MELLKAKQVYTLTIKCLTEEQNCASQKERKRKNLSKWMRTFTWLFLSSRKISENQNRLPKKLNLSRLTILENDLSIKSFSGEKKRSSFSRTRSAAKSSDGWTAGTVECAEWNVAQIYCKRGRRFTFYSVSMMILDCHENIR